MDFSLFAEEYFDEVLRLLRHLCTIPAPSGEEDERVRFCQEYLAELGIEATLDPAKNLLWTLGAPSQRVTLFMAHTDTVFPRTTPLELKDDGTFRLLDKSGEESKVLNSGLFKATAESITFQLGTTDANGAVTYSVATTWDKFVAVLS